MAASKSKPGASGGNAFLRSLAGYLPLPGVVSSVARRLAGRKDTSSQAVDIYLKHLRSLRGKPGDAGSDPVYRFMKDVLCRVTPEMPADRCAKAAALNRRALESDKNLEWAHYYLGLALGKQGDFDRAVSHLDTAARLKPSRKESAYFAKFYHGMALEKKGKFEKAAKLFLEAKKVHEGRPEALLGLAREVVRRCESFEKGDSPDAEDQIKHLATAALKDSSRAASLRPRAAEYSYFHGRILSYAGDHPAAVKAYQHAARLDPNVKEYHLHLAVSLGESGDFENAMKAVKRAVKRDRRYADAYQVWGDILVSNGEHQKAVDSYRAALGIDEKHVLARLGLGRALFHLGDPTDAIAVLEPISSSSHEAAFFLARSFSLTDQFMEAAPIYEELASRPSIGADAHYYLGCAKANLGEFAPAIAAFTTCLEQDSSRWKAYLQRGHCYVSTQEFEKACADYARAGELEPEEPDVLVALARYHMFRGDTRAASECLEKANQAEGSDRCASMALAVLHEKSGQFEKAKQSYLAALEDTPDQGALLARLGVVCCHMGNHSESCKFLQQAREQGCTADAVLYHLGCSLAESGNVEEAVATWRELLGRHPEDSELKSNMLALQYTLGCRHAESERYAEATRAWEECLQAQTEGRELERDLAEVHFRQGVCSLATGNERDPARDHFEAALRLNPDHPLALFYLALSDTLQGNPEKGIEALGVLADGSAPEMRLRALYHQGLAHLQMGQDQSAADVLRRVKQDPDRNKLESPVELALGIACARAGNWQEALEILNPLISSASAVSQP